MITSRNRTARRVPLVAVATLLVTLLVALPLVPFAAAQDATPSAASGIARYS